MVAEKRLVVLTIVVMSLLASEMRGLSRGPRLLFKTQGSRTIHVFKPPTYTNHIAIDRD